MTKIFKQLARHWAVCLVVFALLFVQAYCDLALPDYTSKIVDTGIQQGGIESPLPQTVRKSTLDALSLLMSEEDAQKLQNADQYYLQDEGVGQLSKASKAGMRAALADCPKCHFNMLEGLLHSINCHGKDGAIYVSDLAREIRQPLPAVSRGLRLMEQDGTVVREPDPADRRKTLVRITPKGYELCHQCEQALRDYFASVLARLEPEQVAQMDALRGALMDAILAENAARNIDPKGETNHDKDL
mgnify:CR=1 FL=1